MFKIEAEYRPEVFKECLELKKKHGILSKALLVRKFHVTFAEATKMLDRMEEVKE